MSYHRRSEIVADGCFGILLQLALTFAIFAFGTYCVNYTFAHTLHHTIPVFWAFVLTVVTGGFMPMVSALVVKILILLHVITG